MTDVRISLECSTTTQRRQSFRFRDKKILLGHTVVTLLLVPQCSTPHFQLTFPSPAHLSSIHVDLSQLEGVTLAITQLGVLGGIHARTV